MKESTPDFLESKSKSAAEHNTSDLSIEAPEFNPTAQLMQDPLQMQEEEEEEELMMKKAPFQFQPEEEEEELMMKKDPFQLQEEEEEEELMMKKDPSPSEAISEKSTKTQLPDMVQAKMETSMGADFSDVSIHKDSEKASSMGALAYAQGSDVHFAPGQFKPDSQSGQELIGHELAHVVQQRQGRVSPTTQMKGQNVNNDPSLEREADQMGAEAAKKKEIGLFL